MRLITTNPITSIFILLLAVALTGCGGTAAEPAEASQAEQQGAETTADTVESEDAASPAENVSSAGAETVAGFPVTIEVCGEPVTYNHPPERAVTNDVNITEIFLALGLADKLVGYSGISAYRQLAPEWQDDLKDVPQLSPQYIDLETLVGTEPDFFFAGWNYGFSQENGLTPEGLEKYGIKSYVLTESCIHVQAREQVSIEDTFTDILNIGRIFGVEERARTLVEQYRAELDRIEATIGQTDEAVRVFVYDSGEETPFTAAKFAIPNAMIEAAHGTNIFDDVESSWTTVNWEDVIDRNPEQIIIVDYGEPNAAGKIAFLKSQAALADVEAIKNDNFVVLSYEEATPGPRNVGSTRTLAEAFYPDKFE
jgi:iron complex transport system substrate-binding protein